MVRQAGFEPTTPWFVARYSIQLSYWRTSRIFPPRFFAKRGALYRLLSTYASLFKKFLAYSSNRLETARWHRGSGAPVHHTAGSLADCPRVTHRVTERPPSSTSTSCPRSIRLLTTSAANRDSKRSFAVLSPQVLPMSQRGSAMARSNGMPTKCRRMTAACVCGWPSPPIVP